MAALLAAELRKENSVQVEILKGGPGEFTVLMDGREVISMPLLLWGKGIEVMKNKLPNLEWQLLIQQLPSPPTAETIGNY